MDLTDKEYFESIKNAFDFLPSLFTSDTGLALTDTEQFLIVKQTNTFKVNVQEGLPIVKGGGSEKAIKTKTSHQMRYPKETFGFPIISRSVPIINKSTGNVVGTIIYAVSQEKENNITEMAHDLKSFAEQLTASAQEMASSAEEISAAPGKDFARCFTPQSFYYYETSHTQHLL